MNRIDALIESADVLAAMLQTLRREAIAESAHDVCLYLRAMMRAADKLVEHLANVGEP